MTIMGELSDWQEGTDYWQGSFLLSYDHHHDTDDDDQYKDRGIWHYRCTSSQFSIRQYVQVYGVRVSHKNHWV